MDQRTYPQQPAREQRTSPLAIGSLVASILGLTALPTVGSVIGLVLGYVARTEIRDDESVNGEGLATAGIILGWIGVGLTLVAFLLVALVLVLGFAAVPGLTICANLGRGF